MSTGRWAQVGLGGRWEHTQPARAESWGLRKCSLGQWPRSCLPGGHRHRDKRDRELQREREIEAETEKSSERRRWSQREVT